jgi:NTP pyrophosphatase (non-canonical NTP hydrolase)
MTIEELQRHARELIEAQGWQDATAETRALWLVTEVGELLREVLQFPSGNDEAARTAARRRVGAEMYDVVWNVCDLANILGVDLETSFIDKEAVNKRRTWARSTGGASGAGALSPTRA